MVGTTGLAAQAAAEYALLAWRSTLRFLEGVVQTAAAAVSTPRGLLIAAVLVFLLLAALLRRR